MTLHEAIQQVILKTGKPLTAVEIATALNKNSWYTKKDGSPIKSSQIGARVKNYPKLFIKENECIGLQSKTGIIPHKQTVKSKTSRILLSESINNSLAGKVLLNEKNFKEVSKVYNHLPHNPGLYCIRIKKPKLFKPSLQQVLEERKHNIIYIGIASQSINKRLGQELWAKGHGTFFRSLGAVLGFTPEPGSLLGKRNQNNYKFSKSDEAKIIKWIETNLLVNWVSMDSGFEQLETQLLQKYLPLLNIAKNPGAVQEVSLLRNRCKEIARGF
ncbi:MAG: hypothetical protein KDC90_00665 [Ignavibacteriae bacterium]|nr:hypothetical protein [Ignavibacteriota bacterium]